MTQQQPRENQLLSDITSCFRANLFEGKTIVVSGGSSGIGLEIAKGFNQLGGKLAVTGSSSTKIEAGRRDPNNKGLSFHRLDVRDTAAVEAFVESLDTLDVLVNAAGIGRAGEEFKEPTFLDVVDVNMNSAMRFATAARSKLKASGGCIINIASMLSYLVQAEFPAYTASKTGLLGLTRALAHAFGPDGIRVNAIAPGYHKTDLTKGLWSDPERSPRVAERSALKRWGVAEDLVGAALFLASPSASFITASCLPVDGGYVVGNPL